MRRTGTTLASAVLLVTAAASAPAEPFDHGYRDYAAVLRAYVKPPRVDYAALQQGRSQLDRAVAALATPAEADERGWPRLERMAFWINAYNLLTLRAIVDHYPIRSPWFTRLPRNSIRQIDGVWTTLRWPVAGREMSLDDIEHRLLRPVFRDARVHFAINCASVSCPALAAEPYHSATLDAQLDQAARSYLASHEGVRVQDGSLGVSSLFKWYGDDFVAEYAPLVAGTRDARERAILGVITRFGPAEAAALARTGAPSISYLAYDWSLNDVDRASGR